MSTYRIQIEAEDLSELPGLLKDMFEEMSGAPLEASEPVEVEATPDPTPTEPAPTEPAPAVGAVDVTAPTDASGLLWDARIHTTKKTVNVDGCWRIRRGVTPEQKVAVETELRGATQSTPTPAPVAGAPVVPVAPVAPVAPSAPGKGDVDSVSQAIKLCSHLVTIAAQIQDPGRTSDDITDQMSAEINACMAENGVEGNTPGLVQAPEKAGAVYVGLSQIAERWGIVPC